MCLDEGIDEGIAEGIIQYRGEKPFDTKVELKELLDEDVYISIDPIIDVQSNAFSITSTGMVERVEKTIRAVIDREGKQISCRYWKTE
jgi:hypothetical protein